MSTLPQRLAGILPEISIASSRLLASTRDAYNGTKGVPGGLSPIRTEPHFLGDFRIGGHTPGTPKVAVVLNACIWRKTRTLPATRRATALEKWWVLVLREHTFNDS